MSNDMIGVPRELAEGLAKALKLFTGHDSYPNLRHHYGNAWWEPIDKMREDLCAALAPRCTCPSGDGSLRWPCPVCPPEPVMRLECEKLLGGDGEYAVDFVQPGWLKECREKGGTFLLYSHPPAQLRKS